MSNVQVTKPSQFLEQTAIILETHGWCRRRYENNQGHFCTLGAMRKVGAAAVGTAGDAKVALLEELDTDVASWNDEQRDRRTVVRTLRRVARRLAAQGR